MITPSAILNCGSPLTAASTSEAAMILAIKGQIDYYTERWADRAVPATAALPIDLAKWVQSFHALSPKACGIVAGESAPYPSCVK
jgi:hypothetical protein